MKIIKTKIATKRTIICKNIAAGLLRKDINNSHRPKAGDAALFKVKKIGKHTRIQTTSGNNAYILPGDYILAVFGNRYASEQFEGYIPQEPLKEYHILGQGGAIGVVASQHQKFDLIGPTTLSLVGYVVNENGDILNTKKIVREPTIKQMVNTKAKLILSLGSGMDSGKTTSAGFLTQGLTKAGKKVAYIKLTGTVYTRDKRFLKDYGAKITLDFSDHGFPSTYMCTKNELIDLYRKLISRVEDHNPHYIIIEIADGILQRETAMLLNQDELKQQIYGVIYSSGDSLSAVHGAQLLKASGYKVLTITGLLTTSPLLIKEVKSHTKIPVLLQDDLTEKSIINRLKL